MTATDMLTQIEGVLVEQRDQLNVILAYVRKAKGKVIRAAEVQMQLAILQVPENMQSVEGIVAAFKPLIEATPERNDSFPAPKPSSAKPKPRKGSKKQKPRSKAGKGISSKVSPLLRAVFSSSSKPPDTLEEALERTFGPQWSKKVLHTPNVQGFGMNAITYGKDLERGESSHLRVFIGNAVRTLEAYISSANGNSFPGVTRNLAAAVSAHEKMADIKDVIAKWGVSL